MRHPVQRIAYKWCIHLPKLNFRTTVPNIVLNHWKIHSRSDSQDATLYIVHWWWW